MNENFLKRGYYFPPNLLEEWEKFHAPSKDYSPSASGAFLIWMALDSAIREKARQAVLLPNIKKAIKEIQLALNENITNSEIRQFLDSLTPQQRHRILTDAKKAKEKFVQLK